MCLELFHSFKTIFKETTHNFSDCGKLLPLYRVSKGVKGRPAWGVSGCLGLNSMTDM